MNNADNELFRQALQRQHDHAARMKMPDDMEQRVLARIGPSKAPRRWLYAAIAAAAAGLLLLLLHDMGGETAAEQPQTALQTARHGSPQPPVRQTERKLEAPTSPAKAQPRQRRNHALTAMAVTTNEAVAIRSETTCAVDMAATETAIEPSPAQKPSAAAADALIPADKQALADLYLAEMALQAAYKRQAQSEAIRTYAVSIGGEEQPQCIITY